MHSCLPSHHYFYHTVEGSRASLADFSTVISGIVKLTKQSCIRMNNVHDRSRTFPMMSSILPTRVLILYLIELVKMQAYSTSLASYWRSTPSSAPASRARDSSSWVIRGVHGAFGSVIKIPSPFEGRLDRTFLVATAKRITPRIAIASRCPRGVPGLQFARGSSCRIHARLFMKDRGPRATMHGTCVQESRDRARWE